MQLQLPGDCHSVHLRIAGLTSHIDTALDRHDPRAFARACQDRDRFIRRVASHVADEAALGGVSYVSEKVDSWWD